MSLESLNPSAARVVHASLLKLADNAPWFLRSWVRPMITDKALFGAASALVMLIVACNLACHAYVACVDGATALAAMAIATQSLSLVCLSWIFWDQFLREG